LVLQNGGPNKTDTITKIINVLNKRTDQSANYISQKHVAKVLLNIKSKKADKYKDWLLELPDIVDCLFRTVMNIKKELEITQLTNKYNTIENENHLIKNKYNTIENEKNLIEREKNLFERENKKLEQQKKVQRAENKKKMQELKAKLAIRASEAHDLFYSKGRKKGYNYLLTCFLYMKSKTWKIGSTDNIKNREQSYKTALPDSYFAYYKYSEDCELSEKIIHLLLNV
jgi:hypothetical protein